MKQTKNRLLTVADVRTICKCSREDVTDAVNNGFLTEIPLDGRSYYLPDEVRELKRELNASHWLRVKSYHVPGTSKHIAF